MSLSYAVLGRLELRRSGLVCPPLPPQPRHVLCVLLLRANTFVTDDVLLDALWGQAGHGRRQRLFELVSRLREGLGASVGSGPLVRAPGGYRLDVAESELDVTRFEQLRTRGVSLCPTRPEHAVAELEAAEALWRGPAYLDVDDRPEFDDEIRRLDELRMSCREFRWEALLAVGRHQQVLDESASFAGADVVRERTQHAHLVALFRCGRKAEACRHYDWLWEQLRRERLEPGPELKALYERILADDLGPSAPGTLSAQLSPRRALPSGAHVALEGPSFVGVDGRASALDRIEAEGRSLVVVRGEAGAGKSRLAAELALRAHDRGATVLWGRAGASRAVPYQAFLRALGPLVDVGPGEDPRATLERLGNGAGSPGRRPPTRHDLFDAVAEQLRLAAAATEVVMVVDDLQWVGEDGLALWEHLLRARPPGLTMVATVRAPVEAPEPEWLTRQERTAVSVVDLAGLGPSSVTELARRMGRTLPPGRAEALVARTNGNAFLLVSVLGTSPDVPDGPGALTGDVVASVLSPFYRLPPEGQRLLEAASLAGRAFDVDVVARAVEIDNPSVALSAAREAGLLRSAAPGSTTVEFGHDLVRDAVREHLDGARRRDLHRRLGRVGEAEGGRALGDAAQLADHFLQAAAGDLDRVIRYSVLAGDEARAAFAYAEAARHYRRALGALGALDPADRADRDDRWRRCRLLVLLGETERAALHLVNARASLTEAASLALSLDARDELDRALTGLAWLYELADAEPELQDAADRALALPGLAPARRAIFLAARVRLGGVSVETASRLLDEAEELARSTPDERSVGLVLGAAAVARSGPETLAWRLAAAEEIRSIAERTASEELALQSYRLHATTLLEAGDHRRARREFRRFVERAAGSGRPVFDAGVAQVENGLDLLQGRFAAAEARLPRLLDGVAESPAYLASYLVQLGWLRREQGRGAETLPALRAALDDERFPGFRVTLAVTELEVGDLAAGRGDLDQAVARGLDRFARDSTWMATIADLAVGAWLAERADLARELYRRLAPFADQQVVLSHGVVCLGSAHRFVGLAALAVGRHGAGVKHLRTALQVDEGSGAAPAVARGYLALGRALSPASPGRSDVDEAHRSLQEAARRAEGLGMVGVQAAAEAELRRL